MGLPEDYHVELQSESSQKTFPGTARTITNKHFRVMVDDKIEITIRKPIEDDSSFMNYLVAEIENAVDRYQLEEE